MKTLKKLLGALALLATVSHAAVHEVRDGELIQDAVNRAQPGDTILVYPGRYHETVYIDKDDITLRGVVEDGEWPLLDGERVLNDAVLYSGNGIRVEWLKFMHYKGNAIMGQAGNNFTIRNNWVIDTGVYGIFPQFGTNGLIENNVLSGIEDAAIYVGMCDNVDVRNNQVFDNVAGIEIENTRHALVEGNHVHDNTGGILVFITPGLPIKTTYDVIVRRNFVANNNTPNFAPPGALVANVPTGTGIIVMAGDDVVIEDNIITGNNTAGIVVTDLSFVTDVASDPESEPNPDRMKILDNVMFDNGADPVTEVKVLMATKFSRLGPDILAYKAAADAKRGSCILDRDRYRAYGVGDWADCEPQNTFATASYTLPEPAEPLDIRGSPKRVEIVYNGVCAGCHAYNLRMIGPPTMVIQALYHDNPQGLADYMAAPTKKRPDFPAMPAQSHIPADLRLQLAEYMLALEADRVRVPTLESALQRDAAE